MYRQRDDSCVLRDVVFRCRCGVSAVLDEFLECGLPFAGEQPIEEDLGGVGIRAG
jgi:hypothetical protein